VFALILRGEHVGWRVAVYLFMRLRKHRLGQTGIRISHTHGPWKEIARGLKFALGQNVLIGRRIKYTPRLLVCVEGVEDWIGLSRRQRSPSGERCSSGASDRNSVINRNRW